MCPLRHCAVVPHRLFTCSSQSYLSFALQRLSSRSKLCGSYRVANVFLDNVESVFPGGLVVIPGREVSFIAKWSSDVSIVVV